LGIEKVKICHMKLKEAIWLDECFRVEGRWEVISRVSKSLTKGGKGTGNVRYFVSLPYLDRE
jgi:hypothetical protein